MFLNCLIFELRSLIISDGKATKILANSEILQKLIIYEAKDTRYACDT